MGKVKRYSSMSAVTDYLHTLEEYYDIVCECKYDGALASSDHHYYMRIVAFDKDDDTPERSPLAYGRYLINDTSPVKRDASWTYALTDFTYQAFEVYCERAPESVPPAPVAP